MTQPNQDNQPKFPIIFYPTGDYKSCDFCGISSFAHRHEEGKLPKDFERIEDEQPQKQLSECKDHDPYPIYGKDNKIQFYTCNTCKFIGHPDAIPESPKPSQPDEEKECPCHDHCLKTNHSECVKDNCIGDECCCGLSKEQAFPPLKTIEGIATGLDLSPSTGFEKGEEEILENWDQIKMKAEDFLPEANVIPESRVRMLLHTIEQKTRRQERERCAEVFRKNTEGLCHTACNRPLQLGYIYEKILNNQKS